MTRDGLTHNGGPAFPLPIAEIHGVATHSGEFAVGGMSLRDYFAGQALGAIAAIYRGDNGGGVGSDHFPRNVAAHAYRLADAMLAERERPS